MDEPEKLHYYYILIGDEGLEGFDSDSDFEAIYKRCHTPMKLRCRYNTQRNLECYTFKSHVLFKEYLNMIDHEFLKSINAVQLY